MSVPNLPSRLNPFAGLERPQAVWAWGMYDLANQSFQLLINTLLFGVYIEKVVATSPEGGRQAWSWIVSGALLVVVVLSPVVGAMVDEKAWKREFLLISGTLAAALTAALALVGAGDWWLAAAIYIPAAVLVGLGENVLAAFLPELASTKNMGYVSALGWAMSYLGAIVLQVCVLVAVLAFGWSDESQWRPLFAFAGVWFVLGILPAFFLLRERSGGRDVRQPSDGRFLVERGFSRLAGTLRDARRYRQLLRFLGVFFVYSLGVQTVVYFSGIIARSMLGFSAKELFTLTLLLSLTAGAAAIALARFQDRLGGVRTVSMCLIVWILTTGGLALMTWLKADKWTFWLISIGIGVGLGGIGTASRALVGCFTPESKSAEFFGLWGMVYKLAGVVGPVAFTTLWAGSGQKLLALILLTLFFVAGLVLLRFVDEPEGIASASKPA